MNSQRFVYPLLVVGVPQAEAIAKAFMQNNGYNFNVTKSAKVNKVRTQKEAEITPYFIFNDTQKGGFVIVGGQEGMSDILAYSDEDCFDVDDMPPAAKMWLETYAASAQQAAHYPVESMAAKKATAKKTPATEEKTAAKKTTKKAADAE